MQLIDELIELLSDEASSLTAALLKTKVLLHKLGHKELADWVNSELNGYADQAAVPPYRIVIARVRANVSNIVSRYRGHPIPLAHLPADVRNGLETKPLAQPLTTLEKLVASEGRVCIPIPMEFNHILGELLGNDFSVEQAWSEMSKADIAQISTQVRSRLLDFILELKEKVGDISEQADLKKEQEGFDTAALFNKAVFGNNTTIIVGSNNTQTVHNQSVSGDLPALQKALEAHHVPLGDIQDLTEAISKDQGCTEQTKGKFGPAVRKWLGKMFGKSVDATWQVGTEVAGKVLTEALKNFYGLP